MTLPTAEEITNWYLYGQDTTPNNLVDSGLIRLNPLVPKPNIEIDVNEFMTAGAGRFAVGRQFELVNNFFTANSSILPAGIYTKQQIAAIFDMDFMAGTCSSMIIKMA